MLRQDLHRFVDEGGGIYFEGIAHQVLTRELRNTPLLTVFTSPALDGFATEALAPLLEQTSTDAEDGSRLNEWFTENYTGNILPELWQNIVMAFNRSIALSMLADHARNALATICARALIEGED